MIERKNGLIMAGFSGDCMGPWGDDHHLVEAWEMGLEEHAKRSKRSKMVLCEMPTFEGQPTILYQAIKRLGLSGALHGKVGAIDGKKGRINEMIYNALDGQMAEEVEIKGRLESQADWKYGLVHGERFWRITERVGIDEAIDSLVIPGKKFFIENGDMPGSFDLAMKAYDLAVAKYPDGFAFMVDWLHLVKDLGNGKVGCDFALACDNASAKAVAEFSSRPKMLFGEHGAFGLRMADSHDLETIKVNKDQLRALKRLYGTGDQFIDRLLVRMIETQYNLGDYLKMEFGFPKFLQQRNVELIRFLVEDLGWI